MIPVLVVYVQQWEDLQIVKVDFLHRQCVAILLASVYIIIIYIH